MTSALTLVRYGNYVTSATSSYTSISAGTLRMTHQSSPSVAMWVEGLGAWLGRDGVNTPETYLALYTAGAIPGGATPSALLGSTTALASTLMSSASGGASSQTALDGDSVLLRPGSIYALGALPVDYALGLASRTGITPLYGNTTLYNKSGIVALPDPFVPSSSSAGYGAVCVWAYGYRNEAPLAPASRIPTGTVYSLTPTFEGSFRDLNGAYGTSSGTGLDQGDQLNQFRIQVREVGGTTLFWNTTLTATGTEQVANLFSRTYAGTTLVRGTDYEWRTQVSDGADEWGAWSTWLTFSPADAGVITFDGDPTGKLEVITGIDFDGKWTHATSLAMEEVKVRLYDATSMTLLQQSGTITKAAVHSAAPGTAFTVTWADTGFTDLSWGRSYWFAISGKDSDDVWTNYYASDISSPFTTNAAPTIPANLRPISSSVWTSPPTLTATWTDSDDTTGTGLTGSFIGASDWGGDFDLTPTYNSGNGKWEFVLDEGNDLTFDCVQHVEIVSGVPPSGGTFTLSYSSQTTAGINHNASAANVTSALEALSNIAAGEVTVTGSNRDFEVTFVNGLGGTDVVIMTINVGGLTGGAGHLGQIEFLVRGGVHYTEWTWQARSYDGTLYSGDTTSSGDAALSSVSTFTYSQGVDLVIDSPADEDTITTASMLVEWTVFDPAKYRVVLYADGTDTIVYDSGEIVSTDTEHVIPYGSYDNDTEYDLWVWVEDTFTLEGVALIDISVEYTPPDSVTNVQVSAVFADTHDPVETAIMISHDPTEYPLVDAGDGGFVGYLYWRSAGSGPDTAMIQLSDVVTNPNSTTFIDYHPASDAEYTYGVSQVVMVGTDELVSERVTGTATLTLGQNHVLSMLGNGGTYRAVLTNVTAKSAPPAATSQAVYQPISGAKPITITGDQYVGNRTFEASLIADDVATAEGRLAAIKELEEQLAVVVLCDGAGEKLYGRIVDLTYTAQMGDVSGRWYTCSFGFREERASEGV